MIKYTFVELRVFCYLSLMARANHAGKLEVCLYLWVRPNSGAEHYKYGTAMDGHPQDPVRYENQFR